MTPEAFRARLAALGYTQSSFAREVKVDARTVRRWASGTPIPYIVQMLLAGKRLEQIK